MLGTRRRAYAVSAVVSAALAATVAVFWVRSYAMVDAWAMVGADRGYTQVPSERGWIHWRTAPDSPWDAVSWTWMTKKRNGTFFMIGPGSTQPAWEQTEVVGNPGLWGLEVVSFGGPRFYGRAFAVPHAGLVVVAAVLPALWLVTCLRRRLIRHRQQRRQAAARCARCGYDLRASPTRCPECGTAA